MITAISVSSRFNAARDAVAEVDHLVEHRIGKAFNSSDAVADLAHDTTFCFGCRRLGPVI